MSWLAVYRMCNETVTRLKITHFFQRFSTGFDILINSSPLDPVFGASSESLPGPSQRLAPVIKCDAFLCFQSYIVRDISLTEIHRWLVTFASVESNNCNHVDINSISLHMEWFNATIFTTYQ